MAQAAGLIGIFDRYSKPDVAWRRAAAIALANVVAQEGTSFGQYLVDMPVRTFHDAEHPVNEGGIDLLVEEVAHRVHEDHARFLPQVGLLQAGRPEPEIKVLFVWMARDATPTFGKALRIAAITPRPDLCAARDRVPRRIRPLDRGSLCQLCTSRHWPKAFIKHTMYKPRTKCRLCQPFRRSQNGSGSTEPMRGICKPRKARP